MSDFFKDLPLNLTPSPVSGDVPVARNETAVKKALINLLRTPRGAKPFDPDYGSPIFDYLFSPADEQTQSDLNEDIADVIRRYETRALIVAIESNIDDAGIELIVEYYVKNVTQLQTLSTNVTRTG